MALYLDDGPAQLTFFGYSTPTLTRRACLSQPHVHALESVAEKGCVEFGRDPMAAATKNF